MTDEEMRQDTIERIKQADMSDLSAIHEYLVWSQDRYEVWPRPKVKLTSEQRWALVDLAELEASRAQAKEDQAAGLLG